MPENDRAGQQPDNKQHTTSCQTALEGEPSVRPGEQSARAPGPAQPAVVGIGEDPQQYRLPAEDSGHREQHAELDAESVKAGVEDSGQEHELPGDTEREQDQSWGDKQVTRREQQHETHMSPTVPKHTKFGRTDPRVICDRHFFDPQADAGSQNDQF